MKCYKSIIYEKKLKEDTCSAVEIAPFLTLNQLVHNCTGHSLYIVYTFAFLHLYIGTYIFVYTHTHTHTQTNVCNIIIYAYYRLTSLTEILITNHIAQFDVLIFFFFFYSTSDIIYISQQPIIISYIRDKFTTDAQNVLLVMIAPGNLIYYILFNIGT